MGTHPIFESDFDCLTKKFKMRAESVTSSRSRGSKYGSYRVRAKTSQVDESLFASPKKVVQEKKRETVQVITKDLIRNVIVPSKDPSGQSILLRLHNLNRIKSNSKVKSQSEIEAEAARRQAEKEELAAEVVDRKHHFAVLDMDKKANEGLNDLEHEAKKENEYLLEKARIAKIEQEDRIKKLNELIVDAKVHAIRDLQVKEKDEIIEDVQEEDKRLDVIMEVHRLSGIKTAERVEQEQNVKRAEQEIIQDLKVVEYNRLKTEREAAYEAEQEKSRKAKEYEIQRLRSLQERAQDHQAERDPLRAKRNQEQTEREWRRKEKGEANKRAAIAEEMRKARQDQIQHKLHFQAIQAQRERQEFERILHEQERKIRVDHESKQEKLVEMQSHSHQLRAQIQNRERERIDERKTLFEESDLLTVEQEEHERKIQKVVQHKLDELRKAGIDEKYISEVVRKLHQPKRLTD